MVNWKEGLFLTAVANWIQENVIPLYIPLKELLVSLHVLSKPEHHTSRLDWVKEMHASLPDKMLDQLRLFRLLSNDFLEIMDIVEPWRASLQSSVEAGLDQIQKLSELDFACLLLGPGFERRQVEVWLHGQQDEILAALNPERRAMLKYPQITKLELLDFLYSYLSYFQKEQRRIEPWLIRAVYQAQESLRQEPRQFLEHIHPRFRLHDAYMEFHKARTYRFYYHEVKRLYLLPSTFIAPHLLLGIFGDRLTVALDVKIPGATAQATIPPDFIQIMKALSDPTRTAIFKSLLSHPYCIQQLAELHGISEPAVAKHLKVLAEAELIWSERRGYYVFYQGAPERLEMLAVDIHQFLDMKEGTRTS